MKHTPIITIILLSMFLFTQLIGLFIIHAYMPRQITIINDTTLAKQNITINPKIPYGMDSTLQQNSETAFFAFIFSLTFVILLIILIMKINAVAFLKFWFFLVVSIALAISINSFFIYKNILYAEKISLVIAIVLAYYKIFKRDIFIHNLTELLIYPGIAVIFVDFLSLPSIIFLLFAISIYDIYAVWYSGFMQEMAKFQINKVKIFSGFFVPYADKKTRQMLRKLKDARESKRIKKGKLKKIRVELAILGGGDVIFPLIFAGIIMKIFGLLTAFIISLFSTFSLAILFLLSRRGKFYPAMPFITIGCLFGFLVIEVWKFFL